MGSNDTTQDAEPRPKFLGMLGVSSSNLLRLIIIAASHDGFSRASFLNVAKALAESTPVQTSSTKARFSTC